MDEDQDAELPVRNLVLSVCDLKQHGETPSSRCGAQTVTIATRMYLHGGADEKAAYGDLHLLEIEQMKWSELQAEGAPPARYGHTIKAYNTDLVLFGGLVTGDGPAHPPPFLPGTGWAHAGSPDNGLYILQTQHLRWQIPSCVGAPPSPRSFHSALVVTERRGVTSDYYVIFGGSGDSEFGTPLGDLHLLDLRSMQWTSPQCAGAPPPRMAHGMVQGPEDQLFVFGGTDSPASPLPVPGVLFSFSLSTSTWTRVQLQGTPPLERCFHTFDLIGKWGFIFAGATATNMSDLYILDVQTMRWARPLYEGQVNVRAHASAVLHDKLIVFGGVRDKATGTKKAEVESRISKKLFFLNVLEVKSSVAEGDFKFKLVTVGDSGVGKSCLLTRFVQDLYSDTHNSTIGVDFKTVITMVKGRLVKLQLWDTAGQERFSVVTGNYYRNSDGFIFVYDATNRPSFDHVEQWLGQVKLHHECGPSTMKILVANKMDMVGQLAVSEEEGRAKAEALGAFFVGTSAKTAANVDMAFLTAAQSLVETRRKQKEPTGIHLGAPAGPAGARPGPGLQRQNSAKAKCCVGG
uniref:Uncharacterized protein n=1 Tax=Noctiluca scintillans TaxID=2966 RepID=A0A7S1B080_NOCSC